MIYLDSSALLTLLFQEAESDALEAWLGSRGGDPKVSSELAKVEVLRACRRLDRRVLPAAQLLLTQLDVVPLAASVVDQACHLEGDTLRSLDALHLASGLSLGADLAAFVASDHLLAAAANKLGLTTVRPGG